MMIQIANLIKQSFIDYPGCMSAVVFTQGCNFRCGYCHNPNLVLPSLFNQNSLINPEEVLAYLDSRKDWLNGLVVTGGEPTIQGDLQEFLKVVKQIGYLIKLDTNGSNPELLARLISDGLVDYVALDIKHRLISADYSKVIGLNAAPYLPGIKKTIGMLNQIGIDFEFRLTQIPGVHHEQLIDLIRNELPLGSDLVLQPYRNVLCVEHFTKPAIVSVTSTPN